MPRVAKRSVGNQQLPNRTLVVDNGAYTIKASVSGGTEDASSDYHTVPNCIARGPDGPRSMRTYVGDQLETCKDFAEMVFRRPVENGYLVNWDGELDIWKQAFFNGGSILDVSPWIGSSYGFIEQSQADWVKCNPQETNLLLTEAPNCPQALQQNTDQILFEELEFASVYRTSGSL